MSSWLGISTHCASIKMLSFHNILGIATIMTQNRSFLHNKKARVSAALVILASFYVDSQKVTWSANTARFFATY